MCTTYVTERTPEIGEGLPCRKMHEHARFLYAQTSTDKAALISRRTTADFEVMVACRHEVNSAEVNTALEIFFRNDYAPVITCR